MGPDTQRQIGAEKAGLNMIFPGSGKTVADLLCNLGRGRRGQRQHPAHIEIAGQLRQFQIIRAKVMPPLRNTVRFIHRHHADRQPLQTRQKSLIGQALRRHVQQLDTAVIQPPVDTLQLLCIHAGIQPRGSNTQPVKLIHLVFHQCNQRRHHQGHTTEHQRRQLVTQAFTPASGKHRQRRTPGQQCVDNRLLPGAKGLKLEGLLQVLLKGLHGTPFFGCRVEYARGSGSVSASLAEAEY